MFLAGGSSPGWKRFQCFLSVIQRLSLPILHVSKRFLVLECRSMCHCCHANDEVWLETGWNYYRWIWMYFDREPERVGCYKIRVGPNWTEKILLEVAWAHAAVPHSWRRQWDRQTHRQKDATPSAFAGGNNTYLRAFKGLCKTAV